MGHKRRFQESTNIDGMSSRAICEEIQYWFGGIAYEMCKGHIEKRDARKALIEMWDELDQQYGRELLTAMQRLNPILRQKKIEEKDPEKVRVLASEISGVYERARENGCEHLLDEPDVINKVLMTKIPSFHEQFTEKMVRRKEREIEEKGEAGKTTMQHVIVQLRRKANLLAEVRCDQFEIHENNNQQNTNNTNNANGAGNSNTNNTNTSGANNNSNRNNNGKNQNGKPNF